MIYNIMKNIREKISLYIILLISLFIITIISHQLKYVIIQNELKTTDYTKDILWKSFYSDIIMIKNYNKAIINEKAEYIEDYIYDLDKNKILDFINNNVYYKDFYYLLAYKLQFNEINDSLNNNRNSVFVMVNDKIIENFSSNPDDIPYINKSNNVSFNIKDIIQSNFYNKELSLHAIAKIDSQSDDLIMWQERDPCDDNLSKYKYNITKEDIRDIFYNYGIDGFKSFDMLIPAYVTKYGDMFGSVVDKKDMNKLTIVQKVNLYDYFIQYKFNNLYTLKTIQDISKSDKFSIILLNILQISIYAFIFIILVNVIIVRVDEND